MSISLIEWLLFHCHVGFLFFFPLPSPGSPGCMYPSTGPGMSRFGASGVQKKLMNGAVGGWCNCWAILEIFASPNYCSNFLESLILWMMGVFMDFLICLLFFFVTCSGCRCCMPWNLEGYGIKDYSDWCNFFSEDSNATSCFCAILFVEEIP